MFHYSRGIGEIADLIDDTIIVGVIVDGCLCGVQIIYCCISNMLNGSTDIGELTRLMVMRTACGNIGVDDSIVVSSHVVWNWWWLTGEVSLVDETSSKERGVEWLRAPRGGLSCKIANADVVRDGWEVHDWLVVLKVCEFIV